MLQTERKWYQIYTQPNCEKKLHDKIESLGLQSYLPLRKLKKQWSDRVKTVQEPAFKSYLFTKLYAEEMHQIERLSEFGFFIRYRDGGAGNPVFPKITDQTIHTIETVLDTCPTAELVDAQHTQYKKGAGIIIKSGNLQGYQGPVIENANNNKVLIELQGLNQSLAITVAKQLIETAPA